MTTPTEKTNVMDSTPTLESSLKTIPIATSQEHVSVPVRDIKIAIEEGVISNQLTHLGGFFFTGGVWIMVERFFTEIRIKREDSYSYNFDDTLFWLCLFCTFLGGIIYWFGHRVGKLRKSGLNDFLPKD